MQKEYPRPELVRENWIDLNGEWDFAFDFADTLVQQHPLTSDKHDVIYAIEKDFPLRIRVPFCPESELSGIGYKNFIVACWYRKTVRLQKHAGKRWLLHFEAAYYRTHVFVNGKPVCVHRGGYTPFGADITDFIADGAAEIKVHCSGDARDLRQPSGKQSPRQASYGCYYTRCTGIWQTVWLEEVPENYIERVRLTPDVDNQKLDVSVFLQGDGEKLCTARAFYRGKPVGELRLCAVGNVAVISGSLPLSELNLWDTESPELYDLELSLTAAGQTDTVKSYFGMRKIEVDTLGMKLNGKRVFQKLVLDQGYNPKGIYTVETDKELKEDILRSQALGFNGARLHEKVFERRYLYWADRLGYLVWGEYPNWGFDHSRESGLLDFLPEWLEAVERDYNHPAVVGWCPMNENFDVCGRRQCDAFVKQIYLETKRADKTRPCIDVSWNYHTQTDIYDVHDYTQDMDEFSRRFAKFEDGKVFDSMGQQYGGQPFFLSEFGGLKWPPAAKGWAYNGESIETEEQFAERFAAFIEVLYSNPRVCAFCYTQLYDVEQEVNGLYYYDRSKKFSKETVKKIAEALQAKSAYEQQK